MYITFFANFNTICWLLFGTLIAASIACGISWIQIRRLSRTYKANILFNLDRKYDDMSEGREIFHKFIKGIKDEIEKSKMIEREILPDDVASEIKIMENDDVKRYCEIKKVLDFCELIGYFEDANYISIKDVKALWMPAIVQWGEPLRKYIEKRQEREGKETYRYFQRLYEKLKD